MTQIFDQLKILCLLANNYCLNMKILLTYCIRCDILLGTNIFSVKITITPRIKKPGKISLSLKHIYLEKNVSKEETDKCGMLSTNLSLS